MNYALNRVDSMGIITKLNLVVPMMKKKTLNLVKKSIPFVNYASFNLASYPDTSYFNKNRKSDILMPLIL